MAKMFYTLEEAAEALGVSEDAVREMAGEGQLQQFRDGEKLMFKREQVDQMAGGGGSEEAGASGEEAKEDEEAIDLDTDDVGLSDTASGLQIADETDEEPLEAEVSETLPPSRESPESLQAKSDAAAAEDGGDALDLDADAEAPGDEEEDEKQRTGVSVFDADEVETADPSAATQVTSPAIDEEELALESVASGSGLLDLTRESDDTSLGAELLDEIYPGSEEGGGEGEETGAGTGFADSGLEAPAGASTSVFDEGVDFEGSASGLENLSSQPETGRGQGGQAAAAPVMSGEAAEAYDPAGSLFGGFTLLGAACILVVGMIVGVSAIVSAPSDLTHQLAALHAETAQAVLAYGGMFLVSLILGILGYFIGKRFA